jgi:hypothetical protein
MAQAGAPLSLPKNDSYTLTDIAESQIKDFGSFYLFKEIAGKIGPLDIIQKVFPRFILFGIDRPGGVGVQPGRRETPAGQSLHAAGRGVAAAGFPKSL